MQLPSRIREQIDAHLEGVPLGELRRASEVLSERYRADQAAKSSHLSSQLLASAYLAVRFPATYAAVRRAMFETAKLLPEFAPKTQLDAGSGPGTAVLAAGDVWPGLEQAVLLETSGPIQQAGAPLLSAAGMTVQWRATDIASQPMAGTYDLVTCAYVLSELEAGTRRMVVERLWTATQGVLLLVEPGTPAGWERILEARQMLLASGASVVAPCAHTMACPLVRPDWCHFAERVERSRMHRLVKQADVPWEDEKFIYLAAGRTAQEAGAHARILTRPLVSNGLIQLKLCISDGTVAKVEIRKRDAQFKQARRSGWGDLF